MRFKSLFFLNVVMLAGFLNAQSVSIAKITDIIGNVGYKIMTSAEYSAASKEIMDESKIFLAVMTECKKEWNVDKDRKGSFQTSKIKQRKITKGGAIYASTEKAEAKLAKLEESTTAKRMAELDQHASKWKRMDERTMEKEKEKLEAFKQSFEVVSKKMEEKLGRPVPNFGFDLIAPEPRAN